MFAVLCAIGVASCGGSSKPQPGARIAATQTVRTSQSSVAADPLARLVAKTQSGVIRIETSACGIEKIGTGFLIGPRLIATVEHVVDGATAITLKQGGRVVAAGTVIGEDQARDVALVQSSVPIAGKVLPLAARAPQLGETVAALGFPLGLPLTVTEGSVSGLGRTVPITGIRRRQMVQTDAAVNPGNSGGPLISLDTGEVVGLVDLGTTQANGITFAVSAPVAQPLLQAWTAAPQPTLAATCPSAQPSTQASVPPVNRSNPAASEAGPATTLRRHLEDLESGQYGVAFTLMSARYQAQNPSWVQQRAAADPGITIVSIGAPQLGSETAQVPVNFYARDRNPTSGSDTRCREFQGTASLVRENGKWHYDPSGNQLTASVVPTSNANCP